MQYERLELLIGNKLELIKNSKVLVLGLGGVGGFVTEALARSGFGTIILVDNDDIDITNLNRQIISNHSNIGNLKTEEWEKRIKTINPNVNLIKINKFIDYSNISELFDLDFDYAVDACDTIMTKFLFIKNCLEKNKIFISCMGTGNKFKPDRLKVTTLDKTSYDPIAKKLRSLVKKEKLKGKIPVLYSDEVVNKIESKSIPSSIFVPGTAGLMCANYIFNCIVGETNEKSNR